MKAERRHELRENDLAHALSVARDYLEQHSRQITIFAVVALALFAVVSFAMRSQVAAHEDVWRRKNSLSFDGPDKGRKAVDSLLTMVGESSDQQFVLDGLLDAGRQALRLAREVPLPPDRELNNFARRTFEELLRRFPGNPLAVGVALAGLATVAENDFLLDHAAVHKDRAEEYLTRLSTDALFNGLPFQRLALDRLKTLSEIHFQPPQPPPESAEKAEPEVEPAGQP
jgi:hypothetical protein